MVNFVFLKTFRFVLWLYCSTSTVAKIKQIVYMIPRLYVVPPLDAYPHFASKLSFLSHTCLRQSINIVFLFSSTTQLTQLPENSRWICLYLIITLLIHKYMYTVVYKQYKILIPEIVQMLYYYYYSISNQWEIFNYLLLSNQFSNWFVAAVYSSLLESFICFTIWYILLTVNDYENR